MKKLIQKSIQFLFFMLFILTFSQCTKSTTDPKPASDNSANIPGTSCVLSEIKYFSKTDNALLGGMQLKYSAGNKLSNVLYYQQNQNPGDNGYVTLVYNQDETLKKMISYSPSKIFDFGFTTTTLPALSFSNSYFYAAGKLTKSEVSNTNTVFANSNSVLQKFDYTYDSNGKLLNKKYEFSVVQNGFVASNSDLIEYQNYIANRPSFTVSTFKTKTSSSASKQPTETTFRNIYKMEYDGNGNKTKLRTLIFPDSIIAANTGKSISEIEKFADSVSIDVSTTFDITKPNPSYAFRYLLPENPEDIDMNLPVSIKAGCLIATIKYTFDEKNNVPLSAEFEYSVDGNCKQLSDEFGKLTDVSGFSLPQNNTYIKYYYTGCK